MVQKLSKLWIPALGLVLIALALSQDPLILLSPPQGARLTTRQPQLSWRGSQGPWTVWLDDNPDFTSPLVEDTAEPTYQPPPLDFTTYYWKVTEGEQSSPTWQFSIESVVALASAATEEEITLINEGNAPINLTVEETDSQGSLLTGAAILDVNQSLAWPLSTDRFTRFLAEHHV